MNKEQQPFYWKNMAYAVDLVLCIDATGNMEDLSNEQHIINMVKQKALQFCEDLRKRMQEKYKNVEQFRVRVIAFRDYLADGADAMKATDFYLLPQQTAEFEACIRGMNAHGGGDVPEDSLEALAYAIKSQWNTYSGGKRHVIVVLSDAATHVLGHGKSSPYYPKGMPANLLELEDWWDAMDSKAKRLIIYAPDTDFWNHIAENWERTLHIKFVPGESIAEHTYSDILDSVVFAL